MQNYKVIYRSKDTGSPKSLLKKGMVPGIIYGKNTDSTMIAFENKILQKLMHSGGFYSKIIELNVDGNVELAVYNMLGQQIISLVNGFVEAGDYNMVWNSMDANGNEVSSGIYLLKLTTENQVVSNKITLLR